MHAAAGFQPQVREQGTVVLSQTEMRGLAYEAQVVLHFVKYFNCDVDSACPSAGSAFSWPSGETRRSDRRSGAQQSTNQSRATGLGICQTGSIASFNASRPAVHGT